MTRVSFTNLRGGKHAWPVFVHYCSFLIRLVQIRGPYHRVCSKDAKIQNA